MSYKADTLFHELLHDSELPNGSYKRAWEIVNATEDEYLKYVDEIR